ncbi:MAG: hypothetical protein AB8B72_14425 [Crocinitomicaceae bacterium]
MATKDKHIDSNCDKSVGKIIPVVTFNSCDAKKDCIVVSSHAVFEMRPNTSKDKKALNFKVKFKTFFFKEKAYLTDPDLRHPYGLYLPTCSENTIRLTKALA